MPANLLLSGLSDALQKNMDAELETVTLAIKTPTMTQGEPIQHVYFPTTGLICVVVALSDSRTVGILKIAHDGFSGIPLLDGQQIAPRDALVEIAGEFRKINSAAFVTLLGANVELRDRLQLFSTYASTIVEQSAACFAFHSLDSRLARWLMAASDQFPESDLYLTQEALARLLGVYRPSLTVALAGLGEAGVIAYRRGAIRIVDKDRLEKSACECYQVTKVWLRSLQN